MPYHALGLAKISNIYNIYIRILLEMHIFIVNIVVILVLYIDIH